MSQDIHVNENRGCQKCQEFAPAERNMSQDIHVNENRGCQKCQEFAPAERNVYSPE